MSFISHTSYESYSAYIRQEVERNAREAGDNNAAWEFTSVHQLMTEKSFCAQMRDDGLVPKLHDLWYMYYTGSKHIAAGHHGQARLALQVVQLQGRGALVCQVPKGSGGDGNDDGATATSSDCHGTMWRDLPLMAADMVGHWEGDCARLSTAQRTNAAYFAAELAAAGVAHDGLCGVVLRLMRDGLETPRSLGTVSGTANGRDVVADDDASESRTVADLSVGDFLPAIRGWLRIAGAKMLRLGDARWRESTANVAVSSVGSLYAAAYGQLAELVGDSDRAATAATAATTGVVGGFSPERWLFWLQRLEAISTAARARHADDPLAVMAERCMDSLLMSLWGSESEVRRIFDAHPEVIVYRIGCRMKRAGNAQPTNTA